ncbi:MAG: hypothetical protein EXR50_05195 [Dehalococcoidia bacterium]|nr:hypothetical protein [Dehalococcoidia bacterium]
MIEAIDIFRIGLRWVHALAGVAWVGGSIFYFLVLSPAVESLTMVRAPQELMAAIGAEFRSLVKTAIPIFIFSGVILALDRFSQGSITTEYVIVLALKVSLAAGMFWIAVRLGERRPAPAAGSGDSLGGWFRARVSYPVLVLILGIMVYLLAIVLKVMYEAALRVRIGL